MKSQKILGVIVVLQVLILVGQWVSSNGGASQVTAQVPDAGSQRNQNIDQLKRTNDKLDKVVTILESGKLQVVTSSPDEAKGGARK
jgi:cell division protein FtsB